ncbi:MAG: 4-hydroxy-tetrahydrodipicolinate synthase [Deltaproteobacteria bacterium]|nr:4-hydroxy-tetrahydrodipicolinate synthase [Deltaproteobacteria bacterium]
MLPLAPDALRGSYPPLVTPFRNGEVDYDTFAELVEMQIREGSHGIVVGGTTAEPSTLTLAERAQLLEVAIDAAAGRLPIVAAVGAQSHAETVDLVLQAEAAGATALMIVTPYYIKPPQRGLVAYFADVGKRSDLPLLLYNIPGRTGVNIDLETLLSVAERLPNLAGIKHAANDLSFVSQALDQLGFDFRIFVGLEELSFPMLALGAGGLMNAVGNLAPRKVAQLYEEVARGSVDGGRALHYQLLELNRAVFFDTNPIPLKYMMKRVGLLPTNEHRLPMVPATADLEGRLDSVLEHAGLL